MVKYITTERLSLTILTVEDHFFLQELVNTKGWLQFIGDRNIHSEEDAISYIHKINSMQDTWYWVVRLKDTHVSIGIVTFIKRAYLEHFDIGFAFLPAYNGRGYAYEAVKAILSIISAKPEHSIVLATVLPDNVNSIKLLTKLGLRFDNEIEIDGEELHIYSSALPEPLPAVYHTNLQNKG